jgi:chromosome segregation ATPase
MAPPAQRSDHALIMDAASRAALRLSIEAALAGARRDLALLQDALSSRSAKIEQAARDLAALGLEQERWARQRHTLAGHCVTARDLEAIWLRGEAFAGRTHDLTAQLVRLRAGAAQLEQRMNETRRSIGEALARQRWIDNEAQRSRDASERQRSERNDDE